MTMMRAIPVLLCVVGATSVAIAQSEGPTGDPAAGETIAARGVGNTVVACNFCHGNEGQGGEIEGIPYLAGLGDYYIAKQIEDYRSGARSRHPVMEEVARELTPQQIADVVSYFGALERVTPDPPADTDADLVSRGKQIAEFGDQDLKIQACSNCHGPRGIGALPAIPPVAGQSAPYILAQLTAWQKGDRKNDGGSQMQSVAARLDDASMAAVAAYYAQAGSEESAQ